MNNLPALLTIHLITVNGVHDVKQCNTITIQLVLITRTGYQKKKEQDPNVTEEDKQRDIYFKSKVFVKGLVL